MKRLDTLTDIKNFINEGALQQIYFEGEFVTMGNGEKVLVKMQCCIKIERPIPETMSLLECFDFKKIETRRLRVRDKKHGIEVLLEVLTEQQIRNAICI